MVQLIDILFTTEFCGDLVVAIIRSVVFIWHNCLHNSRPIPRLEPVTNTFLIVIIFIYYYYLLISMKY